MGTKPNVVNALWINSVDINNFPAQGMWTLQDQSQLALTPYAALLSATQALSCMDVYAASEQRRGNLVAIATSGSYCTAYDQAEFTVESANYAAAIIIAGPVSSIFKSDNFTVDLGNVLVQAWWNQFRLVCGDSTGSPWTQLRRGYRRNIAGIGL